MPKRYTSKSLLDNYVIRLEEGKDREELAGERSSAIRNVERLRISALNERDQDTVQYADSVLAKIKEGDFWKAKQKKQGAQQPVGDRGFRVVTIIRNADFQETRVDCLTREALPLKEGCYLRTAQLAAVLGLSKEAAYYRATDRGLSSRYDRKRKFFFINSTSYAKLRKRKRKLKKGTRSVTQKSVSTAKPQKDTRPIIRNEGFKEVRINALLEDTLPLEEGCYLYEAQVVAITGLSREIVKGRVKRDRISSKVDKGKKWYYFNKESLRKIKKATGRRTVINTTRNAGSRIRLKDIDVTIIKDQDEKEVRLEALTEAALPLDKGCYLTRKHLEVLIAGVTRWRLMRAFRSLDLTKGKKTGQVAWYFFNESVYNTLKEEMEATLERVRSRKKKVVRSRVTLESLRETIGDVPNLELAKTCGRLGIVVDVTRENPTFDTSDAKKIVAALAK